MDDKVLQRIDAARKKAEDLARRKERLSGEIDARQRRIAELEKKSREEFGIEISEIGETAERLEREALEALAKAEKILGVSSS